MQSPVTSENTKRKIMNQLMKINEVANTFIEQSSMLVWALNKLRLLAFLQLVRSTLFLYKYLASTFIIIFFKVFIFQVKLVLKVLRRNANFSLFLAKLIFCIVKIVIKTVIKYCNIVPFNLILPSHHLKLIYLHPQYLWTKYFSHQITKSKNRYFTFNI